MSSEWLSVLDMLVGARELTDWEIGSIAERCELWFLLNGGFCGVGVGQRWAGLTWRTCLGVPGPPHIRLRAHLVGIL